jgi:signal transduction histidine kinase
MHRCEYLFSAIILCLGAIAPPNSSDPIARIDQLWISSATALASGELDDARLAASESQKLALKARDAFRTFKAGALLAQIDEASGDVTTAVKSLLGFRDRARSDNDFEVEVRCLHQLAELAARHDALSESATFYSSAKELVSRHGTKKEFVAVCLRLVRVYRAMGALEKAEAATSEMLEASQALPESDRAKLRTSLAVANQSSTHADLVAALKHATTAYDRSLLNLAMARMHLQSGDIQESIDAFEVAFKDLPALNLDAMQRGAYDYATALVRADQPDKARVVLNQLKEKLLTPSGLRGRVLALQTHLAKSDQQFTQSTRESLANSQALYRKRSEFEAAITSYRKQIANREEERRIVLAGENARYKTYVWLAWVSLGLAIPITLVIARHRWKQRVAAINLNRTAERMAERQERAFAIGNLASGVAHDFNNLMTIIYSVSETVHSVAAERLTSEESEMLGEVLRATESGIEITRQLLALSHGTGDEGEFLVGRHVAGVRGLLTRTLGVGIELDIQTGDPNVTVLASKAQLTSALINLCANARDAIDQRGQVTITVDVCRIQPRNCVQICVRDNGCGMSSKQVLRATDRHFTTKTQDRGTGLGLSMVDRFVSEAGGKLLITSQLGRGTQVCIELPRRDTTDSPAHSEIEGMCVLCVDPIVSVTNTVREALQRLGCEVHTTMDVASACVLLDDQISPDVVLLSVNGLQDEDEDFWDWMRRRNKRFTVILTAPVTYESNKAPILHIPFTEGELRDAIAAATESSKSPTRSI